MDASAPSEQLSSSRSFEGSPLKIIPGSKKDQRLAGGSSSSSGSAMKVFAWGRGEDGQLGTSDTKDSHLPKPIEKLQNLEVRQICCGSGHTVVLSKQGGVYSWGRGDDGRLGHGEGQWRYSPTRIQSLSMRTIVRITCGSYHTAAVDSSGDLYTWGGGMYGKLGHGDERGSTVPRKIQSFSAVRVVDVACGSRHVLLDDAGQVLLGRTKIMASAVTATTLAWRVILWSRGASRRSPAR